MAETGLTGDWAGALRKIQALRRHVEENIKLATEQNCQGLVAEIKTGIESQAPGGKPFPELHPYTVLRRLAAVSAKRQEELLKALAGGKKAKRLINHGDLLRSFTYKLSSDGWSGVVGVNRTALSKDGQKMTNIAEVQFKGKTIRVTEKMRAYLSATGLHLKKSTTHITIPAADPVKPTFDTYKGAMIKRYKDALAKAVKGGGGEGE